MNNFFFFCSAVLCIFVLQPLKWCQSQPVFCNMCVCLLCHFLCVCLPPRPLLLAGQAGHPIKRAQGGLLWQQLLWCAVLSVCTYCLCPCLCVCPFVCVCVLLSPGRAGQTGPVHMEPAPLVSFVVALGVFPIGAWSVQYHAASSLSSSGKAVSLSPFCPSHDHFSLLSLFSVSSCKISLPFSLIHNPQCPFLSP